MLKKNETKILSLLLVASSFTAYAGPKQCEKIEKDLLALNYLQQESTLPSCKDTLSSLCCDASVDPNSCKSLGELQQEYNMAMSKLVIAQGMASLGMAIEGHHNSLKTIAPRKIIKAKMHINKFKNSLKRADLLVKSLKFHGDQNFWNDYLEGGDKTPLDVANYINKNCESTSDTYKRNKDFCDGSLELAKKKDLSQFQELTKTMHGFLNADTKGRISPLLDKANRRKRFEKEYPNYFNITVKDPIDGKVTVPIGEYNTKNPHYKKIEEIETLIKQVELDKKGVKPTPQSKKALEELAGKLKNLRTISVSFDHNSSNNQNFDEQFSKIFSKPVTQLSLSNIMISEGLSEAFTGQNKVLKNDIAPKKQSMLDEMKTFIRKEAQIECNSTDTFDSVLQCMNDYCEPNSANGCDNDSFDRIGMGEKYAKMADLNKYEKLQKTFESITNDCLNNDSLKLEEKKSCVENKKNDISHLDITDLSNLEQLKANVKKQEDMLKRLQQAKKFKQMQTQKNIAIYALNKAECLDTNDIERVRVNNVSCDAQLNNDQTSEYLKLSRLGNDLKVKVDGKMISDFLKVEDNYLENSYSKIKRDCEKGESTAYLTGLCSHFHDEVLRKEALRIHNEKAKQARARKRQQEEVIVFGTLPFEEEEPGPGMFFEALGKAMVPSLPLIAQIKINESARNDWSKSQVRKYNTMAELAELERERYKTYLENTNSSTVSNIGLPQLGLHFNTVSTFQSANQSTFINANNPYSFSFSAIPTTVAPLATDQPNPTSSASSTTTYNF